MQELINTLVKNRKPLLVGVCLLGVVMLWIGGSLMSLVHNKMEKNKLQQQSKMLDQEHQELLHTKALLEAQDETLLEQIARTQYDLAKPGEIQFRFPPK